MIPKTQAIDLQWFPFCFNCDPLGRSGLLRTHTAVKAHSHPTWGAFSVVRRIGALWNSVSRDPAAEDFREIDVRREAFNSPSCRPSHMYHYRVLVLVSQPLLVSRDTCRGLLKLMGHRQTHMHLFGPFLRAYASMLPAQCFEWESIAVDIGYR